MNKNKNTKALSGKIKLIIVLMILTITGVVGFQLNWLNNSYKVWSDQFDADVRQSLTSAVEKGLQRKFVEYTTSFNIPGASSVRVVTIDSMLHGGNVFLDIDENELIMEESFDELHNIIENADSLKVAFNKGLTILDKVRDEYLIELSETSDSLTMDLKSEIRIQNIEDEIDCLPEKHMTYQIVINNMVDSFVESQLHETIEVEEESYTEFTESLTSELEDRNISIPFTVGVYNFKNNKFDYLFPVDTDTSLFESAYKVPLFEKLDSPDYASVYFPEKNKYILSQLGPSILGSLILILITVFSFIYILSTIYNQKKLSEIKSDFINNMTHELKTPITTVSLAIEALKDFDVLKSKDQTEKYLGIADGENKRLALLVDRILKVAAYQREELKLNPEMIDVHHLINEVIKNIDVQIKKTGGNINTNLSEGNSIFKVDRVHFNNMIYNLLDNAIKYSTSSPEISVKTIIDNGDLFIQIRDNGIGISKQHQEKIFDKFYRIPTGNLHSVKGHGLGLSYVKEIVEMHGGNISIDSEIGDGSTFNIHLPQQV